MTVGQPRILRRDDVSQTTDSEFDQFFQVEHARLASALAWALGDRELGQAACDEAMVRAYERWGRVGRMSNSAGWVYRVGLNWARRQAWRTRSDWRLSLLSNAGDVHVDSYVDPELVEALMDLPLSQRSVVVMRHCLGYSEAEVAKALGIRLGTVKSRNRRALNRLQKLVKGSVQ